MVSVFNSIRCRTVTVTPQLQNQQDKLLRLLERFSPVRNRYPVLLFLVGSLMILTPGNFKYRELFGKLVPLNPAEKSELWYKNQWWLETIDVAPDWSHRDDSLPATTKHYWIKTKSWHTADWGVGSSSLTSGHFLITMLILICNNNRGNWLRYYSLRSVR